MRYNNPKMPTINVVFGKAKAPATKFTCTRTILFYFYYNFPN